MKFPTIKELSKELRIINSNIEGETDIRLQVYPNGNWIVRVGDSSYDQDHRGYWGASFLPGVVQGKVSRFPSYQVAKDLIQQAKDNRQDCL